jgi:hypothetical protein
LPIQRSGLSRAISVDTLISKDTTELEEDDGSRFRTSLFLDSDTKALLEEADMAISNPWDPKDIVFDTVELSGGLKTVIAAATLDKLVTVMADMVLQGRLCSDYSNCQDPTYISDFLFSYRELLSARDLLDRLIKQYLFMVAIMVTCQI